MFRLTAILHLVLYSNLQVLHAADLSGKGLLRTATSHEVHHCLVDNLKIKDPQAFQPTLKMAHWLQSLGPTGLQLEVAQERVFQEVFSPESSETITRILRALGRTKYNNAIAVGPAGVGKTHLVNQLTLLLSYGFAPDYLKGVLRCEIEGNSADGTKVCFKGPMAFLHQAFLGQTHVVFVNAYLLSHSSQKAGEPWVTTELRMRSTLTELFTAARKEFEKKDEKGQRIGRRTLFIIDEMAILPPLVNETLKSILDETGFRNPGDPVLAAKDPGYVVLGLTTPDEYRKMVRGDSAVERRFQKIRVNEASEDAVFRIVRREADREWEPKYATSITDEAIAFLIHSRRFLTSPPQAMPASILMAADDLFLWKQDHPDGDPEIISLEDAQQFLMRRAGLTEVWFEGPNGEPPFYDLATRVKRYIVGQDDVLDAISERIKTWARLEMGSKEVPVFLLGGASGSGKDTLVAAFNRVLFGTEGKELNFSLAGSAGFGLNAIIEGPPLGNHSDGEQGLLVRALENGTGHGMIRFNEASDAPTEELNKLKVFVESGEIRPTGQDSRVRPIQFPIFIMGQFGEELFNGKTEDEIGRLYEGLTQAQIDEAFLKGRSSESLGAVPVALLERARKTGGIYLLKPVVASTYPQIIQTWLPDILEGLKRRNEIKVEVDSSVVDLISAFSEAAGLGTRGLRSVADDFLMTAISKSQDKGLPQRQVDISIRVEGDEESEAIIVVEEKTEQNSNKASKTYRFYPQDLYRHKRTCHRALIS